MDNPVLKVMLFPYHITFHLSVILPGTRIWWFSTSNTSP